MFVPEPSMMITIASLWLCDGQEPTCKLEYTAYTLAKASIQELKGLLVWILGGVPRLVDIVIVVLFIATTFLKKTTVMQPEQYF